MDEYKHLVDKFREIRLNKAYKLQGSMNFHGLPIKIENRVGSLRHWKDAQGNSGTTKMKTRYGYISKTLGVDGDQVDVYVSDLHPESEKVFVIHQKTPETGEYDEDKCMLGFDTAKEAKDAYLEQYDSPDFFDSIEELTIDEFKEALKDLRGKKISKLEKAFDLINNQDSLVFMNESGGILTDKRAINAQILKAAGYSIKFRRNTLSRPASSYSKKELAKATLSRNKFILFKVKFSKKRNG